MASTRIRQRSDGTLYTAVLFRENGIQRSLSFDDHAEALQVAKLIDRYGATEGKRIHGIQQAASTRDPSVLTVEQWLRQHIANLTGVEEATRSKYRRYVQHDIAPVIGDVPIVSLDRDTHIRPWVNALRGAANTRHHKVTFLSGALNAAVESGKIPANPAHNVRTGTGERREPIFLTPAEFTTIRDNIPELWQPLATWLVTTGTRPGEAYALRVGDIDADAGTVRISRARKFGNSTETRIAAPKSRAGVRTVNVPRSTLDMLDLDRPASALVFTYKGKAVEHATFYHAAWKDAVKKAGWTPDRRPRIYDLRHTNASWLLNEGRPLIAVSRHLGHASIKITADTYGHLDRSSGALNADAIERLLGDG